MLQLRHVAILKPRFLSQLQKFAFELIEYIFVRMRNKFLVQNLKCRFSKWRPEFSDHTYNEILTNKAKQYPFIPFISRPQ